MKREYKKRSLIDFKNDVADLATVVESQTNTLRDGVMQGGEKKEYASQKGLIDSAM